MNDIDLSINFLTNLMRKLDLFALVNAAIKQRGLDKFIIRQIQAQLFFDGEDGDGDSLGEYSPVTVEFKKAKGQPFDHITLKDTGAFYGSMTVRVDSEGIVIDANPIKIDEVTGEESNLFDDFGEDIIKLNAQNMKLFIILLQFGIQTEMKKIVDEAL